MARATLLRSLRFMEVTSESGPCLARENRPFSGK
jgi:hypothetical protein